MALPARRGITIYGTLPAAITMAAPMKSALRSIAYLTSRSRFLTAYGRPRPLAPQLSGRKAATLLWYYGFVAMLGHSTIWDGDCRSSNRRTEADLRPAPDFRIGGIVRL